MIKPIVFGIAAFYTVCSFCIVPASADGIDSRMAAVNRELNCVADHIQSGVNWNDVCYTSSAESDRERLIAQSMDNAAVQDMDTAEDTGSADEAVQEQGTPGTGYESSSQDTDSPLSSNNVDSNSDSAQNADYSSSTDDSESADFLPKPIPPESSHDSASDDDWFLNLKNKEQQPDSFRSRIHSFDITSQLFYFKYREPPVVKHTGVWKGLEGQYEYRPPEGYFLHNPIFSMFAFNALYAWGKHDYDADQGNGDVVHLEDIDGAMFEGRLLLGKDYYGTKNSRITPYIGFGVKQLVDKGGDHLAIVNNHGYAFYDRKETYLYFPIGFSAELQSVRPTGIDIGINGEVDVLYKGYQNTHLTDIDGISGLGSEDATFPQSQGIGLRGSIKFIKHFPSVDIYAEPFVRFWHIKESKVRIINVQGVVSGYIEPENDTLEAGSKLGVRF
jgi:hypothetical protein